MKALYLDIGGTRFRWYLEGDGEVLSVVFATDSSFISKIEELVEKYSPARLGASFAGQVHNGKIVSAPNISTEPIDFEHYFSSKYSIECKIDNDLKCALLAESSVRADVKNMVLLYIGTGFGSAILSNGAVVRGGHNMAGEIGHIPFRTSNRVCGCGKNDCLELFCSGAALQSRMRELGFEDADLGQMMKSEDKNIKVIVDDFVDGVSHALSTVIALFDPEVIVFGGGVAQNNIQLVDKITNSCSAKFFGSSSRAVRIEYSSFLDGSLEGAKKLFL